MTTIDASPLRVPWWRAPLAADPWRRTLYALLALPAGIACVPLALLGGSGVAARLRRRLARGLLGLRIGEPRHGREAGRAIAHSLLSLPLDAVAFALTGYLCLLVALNLAYPIRPYVGLGDPAEGYADSWGGPTLAGAWAVHAAGGLVFLFVLPWVTRRLTGLQGSLVRRLLGGGYADQS